MKLAPEMSVAVLLLCVAAGTCSDRSESQARLAVSSANNAFSKNLYQALSRYPGNIFFSPLSAQTVLAMAWLGSEGGTFREMTSGLQLPADRQQVMIGFRALLTQLQSPSSDVSLDIANKIFAKQGAEINKQFQGAVRRNFLAESEEVNFQRSNDAARIINQWVEDKTRNKIRDLISADSLDASTLMVLVNAIYFKGKWLTRFQEAKPHRFHLDSKNTKEVPMMQVVSEFPYAELPDLKAKALQLPYVGDRLSMLILLPDDDQGVSNLELRLNGVDLSYIVRNALSSAEVHVALPRFRLEITTELNEPLEALGMPTMFGANANFSKIAKHNLAISRVVQKAYIEVSEEGTEAAAASGVQIVALSGANNPACSRYFAADHPFLFYIIHEDSRSDISVLFAGRFSSP